MEGARKKATGGIKVMGTAMFFYALYLLTGSLHSVLGNPVPALSTFYLFSNLPMPLISGPIYMLTSIGILQLKPWAREIAIFYSLILTGIGVLSLIFFLYTLHQGAIWFSAIAVIMAISSLPSLVLLFFFIHPGIQKQFT